jgi:hypothetical protein
MGLNIKDLRIGSLAFTTLEPIPKRYTSEGENISPPLEWSPLPSGTQQLVLICHAPDALLVCSFTHWTIYNSVNRHLVDSCKRQQIYSRYEQ